MNHWAVHVSDDQTACPVVCLVVRGKSLIAIYWAAVDSSRVCFRAFVGPTICLRSHPLWDEQETK